MTSWIGSVSRALIIGGLSTAILSVDCGWSTRNCRAAACTRSARNSPAAAWISSGRAVSWTRSAWNR